MKAVRLYEYGGPEALKYEIDVQEPEMGANVLMIELVATSVNPIDCKLRSGARRRDML